MLSMKDLVFKERPVWKLVERYVSVRHSLHLRMKVYRVGSDMHKV